MASIAIEVKQADAVTFEADVLALKHAQALYGLDEKVANQLSQASHSLRLPKPNKFWIVKNPKVVAAKAILFIGVPPIVDFGYGEIRIFARTVLSRLSKEMPSTATVALTLHGVGYGLDELEAFESEVAGLLDAIRDHDAPEHLQRITILEQNPARASRLQASLERILPKGTTTPTAVKKSRAKKLAGEPGSDAKPRVFVAMPFKGVHMDDLWELAIQPSVRSAGFLCERADMSAFVGDIIEFVRKKIKAATYLVAVLTESNANVYLEVGYAWGMDIPTILLVNDSAELKFDVRGQRCLTYKSMGDLKARLRKELTQLAKNAAD